MIAALLPTDHFVIMTVYALLVSAFFALLWREESRERWRLFGILLALARARGSRRRLADVSVPVVGAATTAP